MSYRNKLLLRRLLIALGVIVAVIGVFLLIVFTYLGRYVVYTEHGAYFSFQAPEPESSAAPVQAAVPNIELVTGEPIAPDDVIGDTYTALKDSEVKGILIDYTTLEDSSTLNKIELGAEDNNTLALEMRVADREIITTEPVRRLISRGKAQETRLIAVISCLSDSDYALDHTDQALQISGGALWMSSGGSYWLDPAQDTVIEHLAETIHTLADMGFDEVVLNDFSLPYSDSIEYDYNGRSSSEIMMDAYNRLSAATMESCKLGLLVEDASSGHQAFDSAERIYVFYDDGGTAKEYVENHPGKYLVFITDSHDTRFDNYGRLRAEGRLSELRPEVDLTPEEDPFEDVDADPEEPEDETDME